MNARKLVAEKLGRMRRAERENYKVVAYNRYVLEFLKRFYIDVPNYGYSMLSSSEICEMDSS